MDDATEAVMDAWLESNVTKRHAEKPSDRTVKALAHRCIADAAEQGITMKSLEQVVCDIEESIADELAFIATWNQKPPS